MRIISRRVLNLNLFRRPSADEESFDKRSSAAAVLGEDQEEEEEAAEYVKWYYCNHISHLHSTPLDLIADHEP